MTTALEMWAPVMTPLLYMPRWMAFLLFGTHAPEAEPVPPTEPETAPPAQEPVPQTPVDETPEPKVEEPEPVSVDERRDKFPADVKAGDRYGDVVFGVNNSKKEYGLVEVPRNYIVTPKDEEPITLVFTQFESVKAIDQMKVEADQRNVSVHPTIYGGVWCISGNERVTMLSFCFPDNTLYREDHDVVLTPSYWYAIGHDDSGKEFANSVNAGKGFDNMESVISQYDEHGYKMVKRHTLGETRP